MPIVVDASSLVFACTETTAPATQFRLRLSDDICHAPHLIDAEFGNALRKKVVRGEVRPELALTLLDSAPQLINHRHEQHGLLSFGAWSLRDNVSFYDALYVVLAATFDVPLVTVDRRLARARGLPCRVEVPAGL